MENKAPGIPESEIQGFEIWTQLKQSGIPLTIGTRVQVPLTTNLLHGADYVKWLLQLKRGQK